MIRIVAFNRCGLLRQILALSFFVAGFLAIYLCGARPAVAQSLSPSTTLQNPAGAPIFANDYAAEPLGSYDLDAYSQLIAQTPFPAIDSYLGATVLSSVYRDPANGYLAFVYQFINTSAIANDLARATVNDPSDPWKNFSILAAGADGSGSSTSAGGAFSTWTNGNPYYLQQDSGDYGLVIQFDVGNLGTILDSPTDDYSSNIWFATNATNYGITDVGLSDSTAIGSAFSYGPAAVPEPPTIVISLIGLAILAAAGCRRRKIVAAD